MTSASRHLDRLIVLRDRLNEHVRPAERNAEREACCNEFSRTWAMSPYDPRRPVAGSHLEIRLMFDDVSYSRPKVGTETEHTSSEIGLTPDEQKKCEVMRTLWAGESRRMTAEILAAVERATPHLPDAVRHAALNFAVNRLASVHGREFVQGRVAAILDAKFDG